jgi:FtsP/CotA-like multicopper oxidase with cupredoxin domain
MMQFRIGTSTPIHAAALPSPLAPSPYTGTPVLARYLGLNDFGGTQLSSGVNGLLINNVFFDVAATIKPVTGTTELWHLLNLAPDAHPIHVHLVKFMVVGRMQFIGPGIDDNIVPSQPVHPHPLDASKPYAPLRWGGVKQFLFDNDLALYDPVAKDIGYDDNGNQLLLNGGLGYRSGTAGMSGKFWDSSGKDRTAPATPLGPPPADIQVNGEYLYLTGKMLPPDANEHGWKDTIRADKNYMTTIQIQFEAPPGVSYTDPVSNELTGARYVIHCHILDHEDNNMMTSYALQPEGSRVQSPRTKYCSHQSGLGNHSATSADCGCSSAF